MKNALLLIIGLLLLAASGFAQVAINENGTEANASAMLDISSTSKGILIPRLSTNQRTAIGSPENGLLVYDTDTDSFWHYYLPYISWVEIVTTASNNLDGLTDGKSYGSSNFLGISAGRSSTATACTGIGNAALYANTTGSSNTALGSYSLFANTIGFFNVAVGSSSLRANTFGNSNIAIGKSGLFSNTTGSANIAIGTNASIYNTVGEYNITVGYASNYYNQTGTNNTIIGFEAGRGTSLHNKSGNIFLGYKSGYNEVGDNKLYIENSNSDTPLIGGDFENDSLFFNGVVRITGGTPGVDKILTSDEDGNATWENNAAATDINGLSDGKSDGSSIFLGGNTGLNDDGSNNRNTGIGTNALKMNTTGSTNTAAGYYSLYSNITGFGNTAFGNNSLYANTTGHANTAISVNSLLSNTTGYNNTTIGNSSLYHNTTGYNNTASGQHSLYFNSSGIYNTAYGCSSLKSNSVGSRNTAIGMDADFYNEEGSNNTMIGYAAGKGLAAHNKSGNIFLGYQAGYNETGDNKLYIENSNSDTPLIGGDFENDSIFLNGVVRITGGTPGADKVLTSDEDGNASWEINNINGLSDGKSDATNVFLGNNSGLNDEGSNSNTGIGIHSMQHNTSGSHNTAVGFVSLRYNTSGNSNSAFGTNALYFNTSGGNNTASGAFSLHLNTTGFQNVAIGSSALYSNTLSAGNAAIGAYSLRNNQGSYNTGIGAYANYYNEMGNLNTIIGYEAGRGTSLHNKSGNIFLGYQAGYDEIGDNKLYIENSNSDTPLIGGDFDADEVYFNTLKLGIGTSNPRELLEVASPTGSYGRMIVSDGGGDDRNVLLFVSPTVSNQTARIEGFNYDSGTGVILNFNTVGNASCVFGGNILPEGHISKNLGGNGQAWNNVYAHNYVTQGSAAFANVNVTEQLISFPPLEKAEGSFDEFTEKGLKELDPASLPENLRGDNAILIDEMTTYNYKANYEQQLQIEILKAENAELKARLDILEQHINK